MKGQVFGVIVIFGAGFYCGWMASRRFTKAVMIKAKKTAGLNGI